ncbi:MAG: type IV pilus assembly protein PilM [Clostridiales bacterium]|jgi:type IV pilus assembly protein PilM|nr:type IV pilus assembly protein PilM [Clostridiales bacterium]
MGVFGDSGVVGLEIDTGVIRAVEVRGKNGSARIVAAGQVEIPESAVSDGAVLDVETVSQALKQLWSGAGLGSKNVVLGTFNQSVLMRLINFPKVPKDKLEQALRLQAGEFFPIPLSQMVLDFAVVGEIDGEDGPQYEVLLVAAKKAQLEQSLKAILDSKLKPRIVDATPLALLRTLPEDKLVGTTVIVALSNGLSSLLLSLDGVPRFARVMPVALKQYLSRLGASLMVGSEDAVAATKETGSGDEIFRRWGLSVAAEIRASISYYVKQDNFSEVDRIILSGRGAQVIGLPELLAEDLGVAVELINPVSNVVVSGNLGINWDLEGPNYAVSVGLALRGLEV